jgi:hypothetical protein
MAFFAQTLQFSVIKQRFIASVGCYMVCYGRWSVLIERLTVCAQWIVAQLDGA